MNCMKVLHLWESGSFLPFFNLRMGTCSESMTLGCGSGSQFCASADGIGDVLKQEVSYQQSSSQCRGYVSRTNLKVAKKVFSICDNWCCFLMMFTVYTAAMQPRYCVYKLYIYKTKPALLWLSLASLHEPNISLTNSYPGFCQQGWPAAAHPDPPEGAEALQVRQLWQVIREQFLPVPAHPDPPGHQALPLRDLPEEVHPALPPAAAHQDSHRGQALQVQDPRCVFPILFLYILTGQENFLLEKPDKKSKK